MKQTFNKLKQNWIKVGQFRKSLFFNDTKFFNDANRPTMRLTGLILFGYAVVSYFMDIIPVLLFLAILLGFSTLITIRLHKWLSKQPREFLNSRRNFFMFLGLLILSVILLAVSLSIETTILTANMGFFIIITLLPLTYTTVFIAKQPFGHPPQTVVITIVMLVFVNLITMSATLRLPTKNTIPVVTPTSIISSEQTLNASHIKSDKMVILPTSKYSSRFNGLRWWAKEIKENNLYANINIEYPQFIGRDEVSDLNKYIRNLVLGRLEKDRNDVGMWIADKEGKFKDDCSQEPSDGTMWSCSVQLQSKYKVSAIVNDIVSIELILTDYTGGGNGSHERPIVINWDLKSNRLLKTEEIFCNDNFVNVLSSLVYESILNQFDDIKEQTSIPKNYSNILIGYSGITIVFSPYYVSSGADGIVRVPIPYSSIPDTVCLP